MIGTFLAAALATAATPDTCAKLTDQLERHERFWGLMHKTNATTVAIDQDWYTRFPDRESERKLLLSRMTLQREDAQYAEQADRIVTLILANKCKAPDHVPSWETYPTR